MHYGRSTEWCTTKPYQSHFEEYFYQRKIILIYAIPKDKESNKHVAIAVYPTGKIEMFDQNDKPIDAKKYTEISGLESNKFIEMSKEPTNQQQADSYRKQYNQALKDTRQLLQERPLNIDAIERLLKFTKSPEDSVAYIHSYSDELGTQVTVHPSILMAAFISVAVENVTSLTEPDDPDDGETLDNYVDFTKINQSTFKSLVRAFPRTVLVNFRGLTNDQKLVYTTDPEYAVLYARVALHDSPFPHGEYAISTSAKYSLEYALMLNKPFPAGERAIATDVMTAIEYVKTVLKKPFPAGEKVIVKYEYYSQEYTDHILRFHRSPSWENLIKDDAYRSYMYAIARQHPFPDGEIAISKHPTYKNLYIENIISKYPSATWEAAINKSQGLPDHVDQSDPEDVMRYVYSKFKAIPAAEPILATHPDYAFVYASMITKRRFPAGEAAIATDPENAKLYDQRFGTNLAQQ